MQKCSLRLCGILLGIFQIIGFIFAAVFWIMFLYVFFPVADKEIAEDRKMINLNQNSTLQQIGLQNIKNESQQVLDDIFPNIEKSNRRDLPKILKKDQLNLRRFERLYRKLIPVILLYCLIGIIFASLLLHGIRKESLLLLKTWLIYQVVSIVHGICFFVGYYIYMGVTVDEHFALFVQFVVVSPIIGILGIKIIYNLRGQFKEQKKRAQREE